MRKDTLIFAPGTSMTITFDAFTVELTFEEQSVLTLAVIDGEKTGFTDRIPYEAKKIRGGLIALSWVETIGSAIIHVIDPVQASTLCFISPKAGDFKRLEGKLDLSAFQIP